MYGSVRIQLMQLSYVPKSTRTMWLRRPAAVSGDESSHSVAPPGYGMRVTAVSDYPNVNTYASAPGSRNVISSVRSRTASCSRTSW